LVNTTFLNKKNNKYVIRVVTLAILIKLFLFAFLALHAPENRFQNDSHEYLETSLGLSTRGAFARIGNDGALSYNFYRTPGYPVFLALLLGMLKLPVNGVILLQITLAILAAWITYKAASLIDPKVAFLSGLIVLYDPPVSIFSLQILSEALFMFILALFMFSFVHYLKNRKFNMIALSALLLAAATYVRPTTYYLGWVIAIFVIYANFRAIPVERDYLPAGKAGFVPAGLAMTKKAGRAIIHALVFLVIVYSLLGVWQERNYKRFRQKYFCNVVMDGYRFFGLYKSYSRNKNTEAKNLTPVDYYAQTTTRSFLNLMTRPGPFKYFKSRILSVVGNILAYPWMVFWFTGFIIGILKTRRNIYYQFILLVILYFITASIGGVSLLVSERFRVPMVPFIAIISAYGWLTLLNYRIKRA